MYKITCPNEQYTGTSASVGFVNGVGRTDNKNLIKWFKNHGYTVEKIKTEETNEDNEKKLKSNNTDIETENHDGTENN